MKKVAFLCVSTLALAAMACLSSIRLPQVPTLAPDQTDQVLVPAPAATPIRLSISFGAGKLKLAPGASGLLEGTATYNVADLKPQVTTQAGNVEVKQGDLLSLPYPGDVKNEWEFKLGSAPMDLTVKAGAYDGTFELGGLSLTGLTIKDGASTTDLSFSRPNPSEMALFRYETGASKVKLTGLANANFGTMDFNSGAGDYTLDFSGAFKRAATVTVSTGLSSLVLIVPVGIPSTVQVESGASSINVAPGWSQNGNLYTQSGTGPALTFVVKMGAGSLTLSR